MEKDTIRETVKKLALTGFPHASRVYVKIPEARKHLTDGFKYFLGKDAKWTSNYEAVADWLTDNHGKGLAMLGNCGTGKKVIGSKIIPVMLYYYCQRLMCSQYIAGEINKKADEILRKKIIYIDDVGVESILNNFGNKRIIFSEIVDAAERQGKLLIISSNLTAAELEEKYGERTIDRLKAITKLVVFRGKSMRT